MSRHASHIPAPPPLASDTDAADYLQPPLPFNLLPLVMVHIRLNEHETNPNPHINFVTALPMPDAAEQEEARQLLRALAAQVRPIMKAHGFVVNSLEEVRTTCITMDRVGYTDAFAVRIQQGVRGEELEQW